MAEYTQSEEKLRKTLLDLQKREKQLAANEQEVDANSLSYVFLCVWMNIIRHCVWFNYRKNLYYMLSKEPAYDIDKVKAYHLEVDKSI